MLSSERVKRKEMEKTLSQLRRISDKVEECLRAKEKTESSHCSSIKVESKKGTKKKVASFSSQ